MLPALFMFFAVQKFIAASPFKIAPALTPWFMVQ